MKLGDDILLDEEEELYAVLLLPFLQEEVSMTLDRGLRIGFSQVINTSVEWLLTE